MIFTFDGPNKLIYIPSGVTTIEATVLYSEWKVWAVSASNAKYPRAMKSIGGEQISPTKFIAGYIEVLNDWRVKLADGEYTLSVIGNLFATGGILPFTPPDVGNVIVSAETTGNALAIKPSDDTKNISFI